MEVYKKPMNSSTQQAKESGRSLPGGPVPGGPQNQVLEGHALCGKGAQPGWPKGCGKPFLSGRQGQVYCCNLHGSGRVDHGPGCSIADTSEDPIIRRAETGAGVIDKKGKRARSRGSTSPLFKANSQKKKAGRRIWVPEEIERLKRTVMEIEPYQNKPQTIRISYFSTHPGAEYVDIRVYLRGRPTRRGLIVHRDLIPQVIAGLKQALQLNSEFPAPGSNSLSDRDTGVGRPLMQSFDDF